MDSITDIYGATLRGFRSEIERRRSAIAKSYRALPNPESGYAQVHRRVVAVLDECQALVERRLTSREESELDVDAATLTGWPKEQARRVRCNNVERMLDAFDLKPEDFLQWLREQTEKKKD
jgi:hypothetical protein